MGSELGAHRATIEEAFSAAWEKATPVAYQGVDFTPPNGPWVRLTVLWGDAFVQSIQGPSGGRNRTVGVVKLNLFDRPGRGMRRLEELADQARDVFNRAVIGSVRFNAPSGPKPPIVAADGWIQVTVDAPFEVDEIVA